MQLLEEFFQFLFETAQWYVWVIVVIIIVLFSVCGIAGQFWDIKQSWKKASDKEKRQTKICCGSCTFFLLVVLLMLLLTL